jgi:glycyl-tRNA synthetase
MFARFLRSLSHSTRCLDADCWDCEVHTSYGWIECAGLADRSAYDLTQHAEATGIELVAYEAYDEPRMEDGVDVVPQMKIMGKALKGAAKDVAAHLQALKPDDALALKVRWHDNKQLLCAWFRYVDLGCCATLQQYVP